MVGCEVEEDGSGGRSGFGSGAGGSFGKGVGVSVALRRGARFLTGSSFRRGVPLVRYWLLVLVLVNDGWEGSVAERSSDGSSVERGVSGESVGERCSGELGGV